MNSSRGGAADDGLLHHRLSMKRCPAWLPYASSAAEVAASQPGGEVWLFGSMTRGNWDGCSDVDLLAIAPSQQQADALADALLDARLGDDVLALSRDALRLDQP